MPKIVIFKVFPVWLTGTQFLKMSFFSALSPLLIKGVFLQLFFLYWILEPKNIRCISDCPSVGYKFSYCGGSLEVKEEDGALFTNAHIVKTAALILELI
jgi:hypothetical protein